MADELPESLAEACYERARSLARTVSRVDGSVLALRDPTRDLRRTVPHSKLPPVVFGDSATTWLEVTRGMWKEKTMLIIGEGRAVFKALQIMFRSG